MRWPEDPRRARDPRPAVWIAGAIFCLIVWLAFLYGTLLTLGICR